MAANNNNNSGAQMGKITRMKRGQMDASIMQHTSLMKPLLQSIIVVIPS